MLHIHLPHTLTQATHTHATHTHATHTSYMHMLPIYMLHIHLPHSHTGYTHTTHMLRTHPHTHSHTCYTHTLHTHASHTCMPHTCTVHTHSTHTHMPHTPSCCTHMHTLAGASSSPFFSHSVLSQIYMGINKTKNKAKIAYGVGLPPRWHLQVTGCALQPEACFSVPAPGARSLEQTQGQALGTGTWPDSSAGPGWPCLQSSKSQRNEYAKLRPTSH